MKSSGKRKKHISVEDYLARLDDEVFDHQDFKRQIMETANRLNLPVEVVDTVVKNFTRNFVKKLMKFNRNRIIRLLVPGWLHIDIVDEHYLRKHNLKKVDKDESTTR